MDNKIMTNDLNSEEKISPIFLGNNRLISALFENPQTAENIFEDLITQGYKQEDITLVMSEDTRSEHFPDNNAYTTAKDLGNKALEGLGVGAIVGGSMGALAAAIAAIGTSLVIPGLGLIIAGPLAASFAGAGVGSAAGSLIGALVGSEMPDEQVKILEEGLKKGGVVIAIKANSDDERTKIYNQWVELQKNEIFNEVA